MVNSSSYRSDISTQTLLLMGVVLTLLTTLTVIVILGQESFSFFKLVSIKEFLLGHEWEPLIEPRTFGVGPLVVGTAMITIGAIVLALPIGLFTAFYLSEIASDRIRNFLKPALEVLAGIPTVVFGYFALTTITPLLKIVIPGIQIFNALSATIVVAIMILPMISSLCDDALKALPQSLKEGGYALGATKNEVVWGVLLPACSGRVLAAVMLAMSRAAGETMAVTLAAGSTPNSSVNFLESIQTMTAFIVQVSLGDIQAGGVEYMSSFAVGGVLFILTLVLNGIGAYLIFKAPRTFT